MTERILFNALIAEKIIKRTIQTFTVENVDFEIMALDKHLISIVKSGDSYEEMLFTAANNGLVYEGKRMVDNEDIQAEDIESTWGDESVDIDSDPCIRARVGEKVCEISGLAEHLEEMLVLEAEVAKEEEDAKLIQVGDHKVAGGTALGDLPATDDVYLDTESMEEEAVANANY